MILPLFPIQLPDDNVAVAVFPVMELRSGVIFEKEANLWRNELAHSIRSYEPNVRTIKAVRLMEHLNYAIVLRYIGYNDEEIGNLLKEILEH